MKNYFNIGKLVATFGVKGELILKHSLGKKTSLPGLETIFIEEKKDELLPWFIEATRIKSETEIYIKLDGLNAKEQAQRLVQRPIWLMADDFHKFAAKAAPISLLGYHVLHQGEDLGEILEVIEQPHQVLCRIELNGKEVLLPVHTETLQKVDKNKKQVVLDLPEGLLDIFLK
jgi:16S rRNA processing protein RimM